MLNCTDQYITRKRGKENRLYSSGTCERDNGNQITRVSNAESALEGASNDSMCFDYDVAAIAKDMIVVSPVSNFDDSSSDGSDRIENVPSYELDCSVMLKGVETAVQEVAVTDSCNKDTIQFKSDATGTVTPSAAPEDGSSVMCPRTEDIWDIDIMKELTTVRPISSLDESCREILDNIENIPMFEVDCSFLLEYLGTDFQKAADVNDHDKDSIQFI